MLVLDLIERFENAYALDSINCGYIQLIYPRSYLQTAQQQQSEAIPAKKKNIYTIQCFLQHQVRFSHIESSFSDKQSVVYTKQSVVSISKSRNRFCTAQVVVIDDVAASNSIGVLNGTPGWQKGRKSRDRVVASH